MNHQNSLCLKHKAFVGIDPGVSKSDPGAAALIYKNGYEYFDFKTEKEAADNFRHWSAKYNILMVAIERQWARGKTPAEIQIHSISKLLINYGVWIGICLTHFPEEAILYPTPGQWQKATCLILKHQNPKGVYLQMAREKFPMAQLKYKKHSGRAAALWLATYAKRHYKVLHHGSNIS